MSEYQLTDTETVIRIADGAHIPNDPNNGDRARYEQWLEDGGVPDPHVPPEAAAPEAQPESQLLYDHENRLRALEGQAPLTVQDFIEHVKANQNDSSNR